MMNKLSNTHSQLNSHITLNDKKRSYLLSKAEGVMWKYFLPDANVVQVNNAPTQLLDEQELDRLAHIRLLVSTSTMQFVMETLPAILLSLDKNVKGCESVDIGHIKGRVNWNKTVLKRSMAGGDNTIFVTNYSMRDYNTTLNRLCYAVTHSLLVLSKKFIMQEQESKWYLDSGLSLSFNQIIDSIYTRSGEVLKSLSRHGVAVQTTIDLAAVEKGRRSKLGCYKQLSEYAYMLLDFMTNKMQFLNKQMQYAFLYPKQESQLLDLGVVGAIADSFVAQGYSLVFNGILSALKGKLLQLKRGYSTITLYLDTDLKEFGFSGKLTATGGKLFGDNLHVQSGPRIIIEYNKLYKLVYVLMSDDLTQIMNAVRFLLSEVENYRDNYLISIVLVLYTELTNLDFLRLSDKLTIVSISDLDSAMNL